MFDGLAQLVKAVGVILVVSVPLGIWKLVDIIVWLAHHVRVSF